MTLNMLDPGDSATVSEVCGTSALRRRLLEMGLTPGTPVYVRKLAPLGDPIEISVRGYELSLRASEAENILVIRE